MFGRLKKPEEPWYFAVYAYKRYGDGYITRVREFRAPDDLAASTAAGAFAIEDYKLVGVLREDGCSIADSSVSERHTADLERELGYR